MVSAGMPASAASTPAAMADTATPRTGTAEPSQALAAAMVRVLPVPAVQHGRRLRLGRGEAHHPGAGQRSSGGVVHPILRRLGPEPAVEHQAPSA